MLTPSLFRIPPIVSALSVIALIVTGCGGSSTAPPSTTTTTIAAGSSTPSATSLEQHFVSVVRQTQPSVAQIQTDQGLGSGVIFDAGGDIVTNAHVIAGASSMRVTLADGRRFPARLVGAYPPDDLAVVSIGTGHNVNPARFGDSSKVEAGDIVLAAGNPLGLQSSVTDGIVSGLVAQSAKDRGVVLPNAIQTSAPINPGNSGGALVDLGGQVIGIPTLAAGNPQAGDTAAGIGFAIPSNIVQDIAGQIVQNGRCQLPSRGPRREPRRQPRSTRRRDHRTPTSRCGVDGGGCGLVPCRFGGMPGYWGGARGLACGHGPGSPVCWCCACSVGNRWECCGAAAARRAGGAAWCAAADACFGGSEARRRRFRGKRSGAIHTPPGSAGVCVGAMAAVFLASACDLRSVRRVARDCADAEQRQRPGEARQ